MEKEKLSKYLLENRQRVVNKENMIRFLKVYNKRKKAWGMGKTCLFRENAKTNDE